MMIPALDDLRVSARFAPGLVVDGWLVEACLGGWLQREWGLTADKTVSFLLFRLACDVAAEIMGDEQAGRQLALGADLQRVPTHDLRRPARCRYQTLDRTVRVCRRIEQHPDQRLVLTLVRDAFAVPHDERMAAVARAVEAADLLAD